MLGHEGAATGQRATVSAKKVRAWLLAGNYVRQISRPLILRIGKSQTGPAQGMWRYGLNFTATDSKSEIVLTCVI
jgi:hypothetical protein